MRNSLRIFTAITAAALMFTAFACGDTNEEINDSQESENYQTERTIINIATLYSYQNTGLDDAVSDFNAKNPNYRVEVTIYDSDCSEDGIKNAVNRLNTDIISGNVPDIVVLSPNYMLPLINSGYMADLYPLMENYDGVKKEDFLSNVTDALEIDGKLPAICTEFDVYTAVAKTKTVGDDAENWSFQQAVSCFNSLPDDVDFLYDSNDVDDTLNMSDYFLGKISRDCVDFKNKTCDFSGGFVDSLSFLNSIGDIKTHYPSSDDIELRESAICKDKALVNIVRLTGFNVIMSYDLCARFGGEDITFVGYPSENKSGSYTETDELYGIFQSSNNPEAAWEFLNTMFSEKIQLRDYSFPVIEEYFDKSAASEDKWNSFALRQPVSINGNDEFVISDETVEKTLSYIKEMEFQLYDDYRVFNMIQEECDKSLGGENSSEECADILNNRISIYMSENQ